MVPRPTPRPGLREPVERIDSVKADDPQRRQIVTLFGDNPMKACDLAEAVRALIDPQGRGRLHRYPRAA